MTKKVSYKRLQWLSPVLIEFRLSFVFLYNWSNIVCTRLWYFLIGFVPTRNLSSMSLYITETNLASFAKLQLQLQFQVGRLLYFPFIQPPTQPSTPKKEFWALTLPKPQPQPQPQPQTQPQPKHQAQAQLQQNLSLAQLQPQLVLAFYPENGHS